MKIQQTNSCIDPYRLLFATGTSLISILAGRILGASAKKNCVISSIAFASCWIVRFPSCEKKSNHNSPKIIDSLMKNIENMQTYIQKSESYQLGYLKTIKDFSQFPLSHSGVRQTLSRRIFELHLNRDYAPTSLLFNETSIYLGHSLPDYTFTEEELLSLDASMIDQKLSNYTCVADCWFLKDQAPAETTPLKVLGSEAMDWFTKHLKSKGITVTKELENFLQSKPDLKEPQNRTQLSELIWGGKGKKSYIKISPSHRLPFPIWTEAPPPSLQMGNLLNISKDSTRSSLEIIVTSQEGIVNKFFTSSDIAHRMHKSINSFTNFYGEWIKGGTISLTFDSKNHCHYEAKFECGEGFVFAEGTKNSPYYPNVITISQ
ncbi:MAG: hypothetical protein JSR80_04250 [Verrucomicrobia bacterium]|nr:hypothetical protein [Verrucomicrobiota bacterium]